jgi:multidrug efflux pump subunit AcrA (membrane-fusion protein)
MPPRLRNDLIVTTADEQGIPCVEVTDPVTSIGFRFYDFEYALAQQLTGQPLEAVVAWASEQYGVELTTDALDQFLQKLTGLGFLADADAVSQSVVMDPSSSVAGAEVPEHLPPTPPEISPIPPFPPADAVMHFVGGPSLAAAEAPARPTAGYQDHRLKGTGSHPWELDQPAPRGPDDDSAGEGQDRDTGSSQEVQTVPPRLEALAAPLPPVPRIQNLTPEMAQPPADEGHPPAETPLAFIAHAIVAESHGSAPIGALDAAVAGRGVVAANADAGNSSRSTASPFREDSRVRPDRSESFSVGAVGHRGRPDSAGGSSSGSWAGDLDKEVAEPRAERRQPPRPELVVMPAMAEPSRAIPVPRRRSWPLFVVLVLIAAAAAAVWFLRPIVAPQAPSASLPVPLVRVVSPQPTTFYRWFDTVGMILPGQDGTLGFPTAGRVQDAMPPGTTFTAGETVARLQGASARELIVNRLRSRAAYYEQLRDSSRADGSALAVRQAEIKLAARKQELAAAQTALRELEIHPKVAGEIAELLVTKGALVKAGAPVFRVRAAGPRAIFPLSADDVSRARVAGFCRVESVAKNGDAADGGVAETGARAIDCAPSAAGAAGETRLVVDLIGSPVVVPGTQVRLASARYDGVFPVPRSALVQEGGTDRLWIASGGGKVAESRVVEIAATIDDLGLVAHGISVGDAVIVDPPADLKNGSEIRVDR